MKNHKSLILFHEPNQQNIQDTCQQLSASKSQSLIDQTKIQIKLRDIPKQKSKQRFKFTILILIITLAALLSFYILGVNGFNNFSYNTRLLFNNGVQYSNSIFKHLSADEVPRWYDLEEDKSPSDMKPNSELLPSINQLHIESSLQKQENKVDGDVLEIIFDNLTQLNYEIVANITAQKMKLAEKLMTLNTKPHPNQNFILQYQKQYYQKFYNISQYEELSLCIVVPTYRNADDERYKINLNSIIKQEYTNYNIVIIDDASDDGTADLIEKYLQQSNYDTRKYQLIRNTVQMKAMVNLRVAAKDYCSEESVMIIVDGDDQLVGRQVFKLFNSVFQKQKVWFVYSNFIDSISKTVGYSRPFDKLIKQTNQYRRSLFITSHLRAFYTKLFLRIREKDLKDAFGNYFQAANDVAICMPILEMSHERVHYLPEVTYGYNSNTGNNNHVVRSNQQINNAELVRRKQSYLPLESLADA